MNELDHLPSELLTHIIAPISISCLYACKKWNAIAKDHILEDRSLDNSKVINHIFDNSDIDLLRKHKQVRSGEGIDLFVTWNMEANINYSYDIVKMLIENFDTNINILVPNIVRRDRDDILRYLLDRHADPIDFLGTLLTVTTLKVKCLRLAYEYTHRCKGKNQCLSLNHPPALILICNAGLVDIIGTRIRRMKDTSLNFTITYLCSTNRSIALSRLLQIKTCVNMINVEHVKICLRDRSYNCLYVIMSCMKSLEMTEEQLLTIYNGDRVDEVLLIVNKQY